MNVSELVKLTRTLLGDPKGDRYERDEILVLLNSIQQSMQNEILESDEHYFSSATELTVTAAPGDCVEFDLPADFINLKSLERVVTGGKPVPGTEVQFSQRNDYVATEYVAVVTGPCYYFRGTKIGIVDPRDDYTVRVYYSPMLADLDDDDDVPEIPVQYHRTLAFGAAVVGYGIAEKPVPPAIDREYTAFRERFVRTLEMRGRQGPRYVQ